MDAIKALAALRVAREVLPHREVAERARAILDRAGLKPLDVTDFLAEQGLTGYRLAHAVGEFGKILRRLYVDEYGAEPLKTDAVIHDELRTVNAYLESDRPLFVAAFEEWLS